MTRKPILPPKSHFAKQIKEVLLQNLSARIAQKQKFSVPRLLPPPTESGFVASFDHSKIYWELHGPARTEKLEKRPIVFCYGLVCSMNMWRYQIEKFSKDRHCILLDYRGHHKSEMPKDPQLINISAIARDVSAVIENLELEQTPHVWGHSMGVNVALELAVSRPELVHSLCLLCGTVKSPFKGMFNNDLLEKIMDPLLKAYPENREVYHLIWQTIMGQTKISRAVAGIAGFNEKASSKAEDLEAYVLAVAAIDPSTFFPLLNEMIRGLQAGIAPKVKTPALVIGGTHDLVTPLTAQKEIAQLMPNADFAEVPAGSHNVELDFGDYVCLKAEEYWKLKNLR